MRAEELPAVVANSLLWRSRHSAQARDASLNKPLEIRFYSLVKSSMSRAIRRRQKKPSKPAGSTSQSTTTHALFKQAVAYHQAHRFEEAGSLYQQILEQQPQHADSLHLLGLTQYQRGRNTPAADLISRAIQSDSTKPHFHFNLGLVFEKTGELDKALRAYQQALHLKPSYTEAQTNRGNIFRRQGKLDHATQTFMAVLRAKPNSAEAHNNLGVALKEQGNIPEAIRHYREAVQIDPTYAEAYNNLGIALKDDGNLSEATAAFRQALQQKPGYAKAHHHLGLTLLWNQQMEEALLCFKQSANLTHNHKQPAKRSSVTGARIKHDLEQVFYLQDLHSPHKFPQSYVDRLFTLRSKAQTDGSPSDVICLTPQDNEYIAPSFNQILHMGEAPTLPDGALNPDLNVMDIESTYHAKQPETIFIDKLLNDKALSTLRAFCLESTIWKKEYRNGYLGTFLGEGFACPLLLQISDELRTRFPGIFQEHQLMQAWAFKHDSELQGLNLHADAAAVNVNFWITPDEANLDPTSGGLVVWDKEAPNEWDFKTYNSEENTPKIQEFLKEQHANAMTIPHRQNRAVIFNSNLFHATDALHFKPEYESRRINVTLLYGSRQQSKKRP